MRGGGGGGGGGGRGGGGLSQSIGMPASVYSMAVQKKQSVAPPSQGPLSTRAIESQTKTNRFEKRENGCTSTPISQTKKISVSPKKFGENCHRGPRITGGSGTNYDERLKAVRERKEEHQKLVASRELDRLKKEEQARRLYEQQLRERKKKLREQRQKEDNRRAVVEEKRQQRLKEEKERKESAVRKTQEKSQRAVRLISENARGRKNTKNVSFHSTNTSTTPSPPKPPQQSAAVFQRLSASPSANNRQQRTNSPAQIRSPRQQSSVKPHVKNDSNSRRSAVKASTGKPGGSASPSPQRSAKRSSRRRSSLLQLELPSVPEEDVTVCSSALSPGNSRPVRTFTEGQTQEDSSNASQPNPPDREKQSLTADNRAPPTPKVKHHPAGTTNPEDGYGSLAEKKNRQAQLQREREEKERLQREEAERQKQQELELRRAEERARQQAEAQLFLMEKRRREEEEQRQAEEERAQALREAALLQKRREEEQAKAEQKKQEQQLLVQKAEAERQVRKKRLEEIMRRTRRTDSPDTTSAPARASPKENTEPAQSDKMEDAVRLPRGTKTGQLLNNEADMVPAVAFKERSSLRMISGLEEIQAHQRAEVI